MVNFQDSEPPSILNIPDDVIVPIEDGKTTSTAVWVEPIAIDNSGVLSLTSSQNPGDLFPPGKTKVTYKATDAAGNTVSESFLVIVTGKYFKNV